MLNALGAAIVVGTLTVMLLGRAPATGAVPQVRA
jgi:hypothetical protein